MVGKLGTEGYDLCIFLCCVSGRERQIYKECGVDMIYSAGWVFIFGLISLL